MFLHFLFHLTRAHPFHKPTSHHAVPPVCLTRASLCLHASTRAPDRCLCPQLRVEASDGRKPARTAQATVRISITRDESKPVFSNTPYTDARVSENSAVKVEFYTKVKATDGDLQVSRVNRGVTRGE